MMKRFPLLASLATLASALQLQSGEQSGLQVLVDDTAPLVEDLKKNWYAIQFVGLDQGNDAGQPNSPFETNSLCLTGETPTTSSLDGVPLNFFPCASFDLVGHNAASTASQEKNPHGELAKDGEVHLDEELRDRQKFGFTEQGKIHSKHFANKCLRRSLCGDRYMYDLAECDDAGVAVFLVSRSIANSQSSKPLGRPLQALAYDHGCSICGPYQVTQFCKGEEIAGSGKCVRGEKDTGWTRDQSQFIDREKAAQRQHNVRDWISSFSDTVQWIQADSGIGKLDDRVCGSTAGDYPSVESYFYFKKF